MKKTFLVYISLVIAGILSIIHLIQNEESPHQLKKTKQYVKLIDWQHDIDSSLRIINLLERSFIRSKNLDYHQKSFTQVNATSYKKIRKNLIRLKDITKNSSIFDNAPPLIFEKIITEINNMDTRIQNMWGYAIEIQETEVKPSKLKEGTESFLRQSQAIYIGLNYLDMNLSKIIIKHEKKWLSRTKGLNSFVLNTSIIIIIFGLTMLTIDHFTFQKSSQKKSEVIKELTHDIDKKNHEIAIANEYSSNTENDIEKMIENHQKFCRRIQKISHQKSDHIEKLSIAAGKVEDITSEEVNTNELIHIISRNIESSQKTFDKLKNFSEEIVEKSHFINDIVFKTHLLAFNASIEAARAGENGQVFGFVAEEVKNLAGNSGQASEDISNLIEQITLSLETYKNQAKLNTDQMLNAVKANDQTFSKITSSIQSIPKTTKKLTVSNHSQKNEVENAMSKLEVKSVATIKKAKTQITSRDHRYSTAKELTFDKDHSNSAESQDIKITA